jgi:hypothetical protein
MNAITAVSARAVKRGSVGAVKKVVLVFGLLVLAGVGLLLPMGGGAVDSTPPTGRSPVPFPEISADPPKKPLSLLFIHHSVGGRLLADAGPKQRIDEEIWKSHPEGGGLRALLTAAGYEVHEASYGSVVGDKTDLPDWQAKFRDQMDRVLSVSQNDQPLPDGKKNQIVVFKSCFPNNQFDDDAAVEQAKRQLSDLLPLFAARPEVLFVYLTAPPLAPKVESQPAWKSLMRTVLGKPQPKARLAASGPRARRFNNWVVDADGWLKGYAGKNVVAFDLFDILTDGKSSYLAFPTGGGTDSHPSREGNAKVAAAFVPFLNRAVRRAGLSP